MRVQPAEVRMWTEAIARDLRFAVRQLKRSPGFTAVALAAIALGIGATSAVFSFVNAVYLRASPFAHPERLVALHRVDQQSSGARDTLTAAQYEHLRRHATAFTDLAAQNWSWMWLSHGDRSVELQGSQVSSNYFSVLGLRPHIGVFFRDHDDASSVVLSHRTWIRTFDGDPAVIGQSVRINRQPFTIAGVAPQDFGGIYHGETFGLWVLARQPEGVVVAHLRPDVSAGQARAEVDALASQLAPAGDQDRASRVVLEPLRGLHPNVRQALGVFPALLAAATICLLAVACANVGGLLMARAGSRRKEIALRVSLGASRARLVQQLLTESILISAAGGVIGLWIAVAGCRLLEQFFGYQIPDMRLVLDWRIVALSAGLSVTAGIAFGLAPAYLTTRTDLTAAMRERSYAGVSAIAIQTGLCAILLIGAGLLFQSMRAVLVRPGVSPDKVAHFRLRPSRVGYTLERARSYQRELVRRVEAVPGVERAVLARVPPERGWCCDVDVARPGENPFKVPQNEVTPGFLPAMGIPILSGRDFADGDRNVVILNQMLADRLWPNQYVLDREVWIAREPYRVIGIAANSHALQPGEHAYPYLYMPMWGRDARDARLFVRATERAGPILEQLRRVVVSVDPDVHVGQESTLAGRTEMSYQRERLLALILKFTGGVALLLGAVGLYGFVSYQVSRRTREIGIRMALGAQRSQVIAWIMRRALLAAGVGVAAGALAAWQASPMLSAFLYGVEPADPLTFGAVIAVMGAVALAASFVPARRVSRVDPATALRIDA